MKPILTRREDKGNDDGLERVTYFLPLLGSIFHSVINFSSLIAQKGSTDRVSINSSLSFRNKKAGIMAH
jgi:hypothetical protein